MGLRIRGSRRMLQQQSTQEEGLSWIPEANSPIVVQHEQPRSLSPKENGSAENSANVQTEGYLAIPKTVPTSNSADTLTGKTFHICFKQSNLLI